MQTESPRPCHARTCGIGLACVLAGDAVRLVEISGAVPASEFAPAAPFYAASLPVMALGVLLLAAGAAMIARGRPRNTDRLALWLLPGAAAVAAGISFEALLIPGTAWCLLCLLLLVTRRDTALPPLPSGELERVQDALLTLRWRRLPGVFLRITALAALAGCTLGLLETVFYTARFVPHLVGGDQLRTWRLALPGFFLAPALELAWSLTLCLVLMYVAFRLLQRWGRLTRENAPWMLALLTGQAIGLGVALQVRSCLGDEIDQIGVDAHLRFLCVLLGAGISALLLGRLGLCGAQRPSGSPQQDLGAVLQACVRWLFVPPRFLLGRKLERRILFSRAGRASAVLLTGGVMLLALVYELYPTVEDFRMQLFDGFARVASFTATGMLFALLPWEQRSDGTRRLLHVASILVVVSCGVSAALLGTRPEMRRIAHEYTRFGSVAAASSLAGLVDPFTRIGASDSGGTAFPFHPESPLHSSAQTASTFKRLDRPLIVFVIWDAARPDHCSAYGYGRPTTPHFEALARTSVRFENVYSTATATTAAVRMMLSGCYCTRFMLSTEHQPYLVKHLADQGYDRFVITVTGTDYNGVSAESFTRGWDAAGSGARFITKEYVNKDVYKPDGEKTDFVIDSLRSLAGEEGGLSGTFAFLHLTGTHTPWVNADPVLDFGKSPGDRYDGELAKVDALLGRLVDALRHLGVMDETLLVVTADHGTGLGEHGRLAGYLMYEEQIRVPLVVHAPGIAPAVVTDRVATIDYAPTLLDIVGAPLPGAMHGRSLLPLMTGEAHRLSARPLVSFCAFRDSYAVLGADGRYKLHHHRRRRYEALYDLEQDPGELKNLITDLPDEAGRLRDILDAFLWAGRNSWGNPFHYRAWDGPR